MWLSSICLCSGPPWVRIWQVRFHQSAHTHPHLTTHSYTMVGFIADILVLFSVCLLSFFAHLLSFYGLPWWLSGKRICLPRQEMWVQSPGQEDPLEEEMAPHSSILAWEIPWTEKSGGLPSMGSQRVRHNSLTKRQKGATSSGHWMMLMVSSEFI